MSVKLIHMGCALLTFLLFTLRGLCMLSDSPLRHHKVLRILPHVVDTLLLLSGLYMALSLYTAFYTQPWLQAKLLALLCYIVAGSLALKYGRNKRVKTQALLVAWTIFVYIVLVAKSHSPLPYL